ncbi:conserved protein, unknown function [Hepatocystis sp. ex Piliocolobus tephrosceles]|nr:conserved protein, unknown function [Hepatocystis sp. ex Piliocolobus tephrosceles]
MKGGLAIFIFIFCISCAYVNCMNPVRRGNENFPPAPNTISDDDTTLDSALPSFNIHYNHEPQYWNTIETIEQENNTFLIDMKNEIRLMEEDKKKINYVLNIQKQQIEQLLMLINRIKYMKKNNKEQDQEEEYNSIVSNYLRPNILNNQNVNYRNNRIKQMFNEISDYTFDKSRLTEQDNFYHNLAEQWIR